MATTLTDRASAASAPSASPDPGFVSSLFNTLASYIQNNYPQSQIETDLEKNFSVPAPVATIVAQALTNGGTFSFGSGDSTTLGALLNPFLPSGYPVPKSWDSVKVDTLSFSYSAADQSFEFDGSVTIPLELAGQSVNWGAALTLSSAVSNGETNGSLSANFTLGSGTNVLKLDGNYEFSSESQKFSAGLSASSGQLSLNSLCGAFGLKMPPLWDGISDISLTSACLELDMSDATDTLQITADYSAGNSLNGEAFATVISDDGKWKLVFGGVLGDFSSFPVIGSALGSNVKLDLTAAFTIVSTDAISSFNVPPMGTQTDSPFQGHPLNIAEAGAMIGALIDLSNPSGTCATNLANFNKSNAQNGTNILITADLGAEIVTLTADLGVCKLSSDVSLDLTFEIFVTGAMIAVQLSSSITFGQTNPLSFDLAIDLTLGQVFGTLSVESSAGIQLPSPLSNVYVDSLTGLLGIAFDKGEATAGFVAQFNLGSAPASGNSPSTDSVQGLLPGYVAASSLPAPSSAECALVGGIDAAGVVDLDLGLLTVSQISLGDICTYLLNITLPDDFKQAVNGISLNEILIYWCDDLPGNFAGLKLKLPDGTALASGFVFQGGLSWGSFQGFANVTMDDSGDTPNFSGTFTTSPITIGTILSIQGDGDAPGVTAGGPIVAFKSAGPTYLQGNWQIQVLDFSSSMDVTVSSDAFTFSFDANDPAFTSNFDCTLTSLTSGWKFSTTFAGGLNCTVNLAPVCGADLGPIDIDSSFSATLAVDTSAGFTLTIDATFDFEGATLTVPTISLDATEQPSSLDDLPKLIADHVVSGAQDIFANLVNQVGNLLTQYGDCALKFLDSIGKDIRNAVESILGIHQDKKPSYLQNGNLLKADGDPIYEISNYKLRWVPDITTYNALYAQNNASAIPVPDLILASLQMDTVIVPSRVDGTIIPLQGKSNLYLSISDGNDKANGTALYAIQDPTAFIAACSSLRKYPVWQKNQNGQQASSASDDIGSIPKNSFLSQFCTLQAAGSKTIAVFMDGVLWNLDFPTFRTLQDKLLNFYALPASLDGTYDAIPCSASSFPTIAAGTLVKSDKSATVYYVASKGSEAEPNYRQELQYVSADQYTKHFQGVNIKIIADAFFQLLNVGGNY